MMTDARKSYRSIRLSQGTIRYQDTGEGETLVFVHGLLVNSQLWRKVTPLLAKSYRCIVPDWPLGSHTSPMQRDADLRPPGLAKLIAEFLAALDLQNVTLVGNDTGGALCQLVVTHHPERIKRLVLTDCDAFENFPPKAFLPLQWGAYVPGFLFELAQLMRFEAMRYAPTAYGWLSKRRIPKAVLDDYLQPTLASRAIRRDVSKVLRGISKRYTLEAAKKLTEFQQPVLLAWARADRFFKFRDAERLHRILPNSELVALDDALTYVPEDQPEQLVQLIDEFMQTHNAQSKQEHLVSVA